MSSVLFYIGIAGFACGIFTACFIYFPFPSLVFVSLIGLVFVLMGRRRGFASSAPHLVAIGLFLCFAVCGYLRMGYALASDSVSPLSQQVGSSISFTGVVAEEPEDTATNKQVYVRAGHDLLLVTADKFTELTYGQEVTVHGQLEEPKAFATDGGRTFNYPGYLHARGVWYIVSFAEIAPTGKFKGNSIIGALLKVKHSFMHNTEAVITQPEVGLGEGLLLGVKQALGKKLEDDFRTVGITHVVVLSGYNIMLVVTFVMYVLAFVLPLRARIIVGGVAVVLFACTVGLSATVVRAGSMAVLVLLAKATGRTYDVLRALMLTAAVMLLLNPYLLVYDVGFQLSFIATLGLILVAPYVESFIGFVPTHIGLREFVTATISAQIFVTPILLYQMGQFSLVAVVVNVLVLPMVPLAMLLTFITGIIASVSTVAALPCAYLAYLSLAYILLIVKLFSAIPFAAVVVPQFPFFIVVLSYALLAIGLWKLSTLSRRDNSLRGWRIVDEDTLKEQLRSSMVTHRSEVPVFFK